MHFYLCDKIKSQAALKGHVKVPTQAVADMMGIRSGPRIARCFRLVDTRYI